MRSLPLIILSIALFGCNQNYESKNIGVIFKSNLNELGICPKCNKTDQVIPIEYGMPGPEMIELSEKGVIALGGGEVWDDSPKYYCKRDQIDF